MQKRQKKKVEISTIDNNDKEPAVIIPKKQDHLIIGILTIAFIVLVFFLFSQFIGTNKETLKDEAITLQEGTIRSIPVDYYGVVPYKGSENASIVLLEFGDYQCEFCQKFHTETYKIIESEFIETQNVKFYYRDFPQSELHDKALVSARAAFCAFEQDKFWQMHDLLYDKVRIWSTIPKEQVSELFTEYADEIGIDKGTFSQCIKDTRYEDTIATSLEDGLQIGVRGTPTFLIYLPKNAINESETKELAYAARGTPLQDENHYIIVLEGNRNYAVFEAIFKSIS